MRKLPSIPVHVDNWETLFSDEEAEEPAVKEQEEERNEGRDVIWLPVLNSWYFVLDIAD